jgi:hypothetical protein
LIDSEPVLWHLYEGWKTYRKYLEPIKGMEGRQIETWNGYRLATLNKETVPSHNGNKLETSPWIEVFASLLQWHSSQTLPVYVFSLGQTNTTYGFINIHFPELQRLSEARHTLKRSFLSHEQDDATFWKHYEPDFSLREACQLGEIGLRSLRPKDYAKMMEGKYSLVKLNDKNKQTFFNIQTWIIAMLNNKSDLQQLAAEFATELVAAESKGNGKDRGKMTDNADSKALFEANGLTTFIEAVTTFLEKNETAKPVCRAVADKSIRIPGEQFPLFKALIRFEYIFQKSN